MAFQFPFSNLHELNLDWILSKVKTLVDNNEEFNDKADYAVQTADDAKAIAEQAAQAQIADGAVTTSKIAYHAVTRDKLDDGVINSLKIEDAAVTNAKIADGAVTTVKIADEAVTSAKLTSAIYSVIANAKVVYDENTILATDMNTLPTGRAIMGRWSSNSTANPPTTSPNFSGLFLHYAASSANQIQLALMASYDRIYIRSCNSGTWSAWKFTTIT